MLDYCCQQSEGVLSWFEGEILEALRFWCSTLRQRHRGEVCFLKATPQDKMLNSSGGAMKTSKFCSTDSLMVSDSNIFQSYTLKNNKPSLSPPQLNAVVKDCTNLLLVSYLSKLSFLFEKYTLHYSSKLIFFHTHKNVHNLPFQMMKLSTFQNYNIPVYE